MTFTIVARCPQSGEAGVALATVSIAAGGLCPFYTSEGDIVVSQAYANRDTGLAVVGALHAGRDAAPAMAAALAADAHASYRQLLVLARTGATLAHTGATCRPWAGHIVGDGVIVAGNVLAGRHVIEAMLAAYRGAPGEPLAERLVRALEAGRDAGGQSTADGLGLSERSAMVRVLGGPERAVWPAVDLRIDLDASAVHALRHLYTVHGVYAEYSDRRENDPPHAGSIVGFEAERLKAGGEFARRPSVYR